MYLLFECQCKVSGIHTGVRCITDVLFLYEYVRVHVHSYTTNVLQFTVISVYTRIILEFPQSLTKGNSYVYGIVRGHYLCKLGNVL